MEDLVSIRYRQHILVVTLYSMFSTCPYHYNKRLSHFCPNHDEVICDKCMPESHGVCRKIQTIEEAAESAKFGTTLRNLEIRIRNLRDVVIDVLKTNEENNSNLTNEKHSIRKKIKDIRSRIDSHLDQVEHQLVNELVEKYNKCSKEFEKHRQTFERQKRLLEEWSNDIKVMKNHGSSIHLFSMAKTLSQRQKESETNVQKYLANSKTRTLDFESSKILTDMKTFATSFGKINIKESAASKTIDKKRRAIVENPSSDNSKQSYPTITKFDTTVFGTNVEVHRGCFLPDDRLLIPDTTTKSVFVCRMDGSNVRTIKLRYKPRDVCLLDKSRALISCGDNGILIFDIRTLSPGTSIEPGGHCSAIAYADEKIFVANGDSKISVVDIKGKIIKEHTLRHDPYMISVSKSGAVYWTNFNNNHVNAISPTGAQETIYNGSDLRESAGVAVDNRNNIFVAGCESSNIVRISRSEKSSLTLFGKRDGVHCPLGISLNIDRSKLMVINNQQQIKIYRSYIN